MARPWGNARGHPRDKWPTGVSHSVRSSAIVAPRFGHCAKEAIIIRGLDMSGTFEKREKGFEAKWAHDEELRFRVYARRNKLLGLWAAAEMGVTGPAADNYAKEVIAADFERPG